MKQDSLQTSREVMFASESGDFLAERQLSLSDIWRTIFKHVTLILCSVALFFGTVALYTFLKAPVFESVARLQIDMSQSASFGLGDMIGEKLGSTDSDSRIQTEVKVIQSDTVAMRVIDTLELARLPAFAGKSAANARVTNPLEMSARAREVLVNKFKASLTVHVLPGTKLVEVRFRSTDPKLATDVVNSVIENYMKRNLQSRYDGTVQVSNWLSGQMIDLQTKAAESQQQLAEFQKKYNVIGSDENDNIVIDRLKLLNQQLTEAEADRIVKEARHRMAASGNPELVASVTPNLQILRTQEADLKAQIAQLNSKYGSGYPRLREEQVQLSRLEADIADEIGNVGKRLEDEYLSAAKTESLLRGQFNEQKQEAFQLNEHAVQYAVLRHDVENGRDLYDALQMKLKMAGVTAGLSTGYISIVDRAVIPASPVAPRKTVNLGLGIFGGLALGLILAFIVESLDDTLSSSEELESCVALPVLCSIPVNSPPSPSKTRIGESEESPTRAPVLSSHPRSQASEAFRGLRTSLLLSSPERTPKVISIVSSVAAEGKTTVASNLGVAFAQRGESVLMIDADLRRSSMHVQFGLPHFHHGTSTVLTQGMRDSDVVTPIRSLPNLKLMPAGPHPPNPAELLGSKRMTEVLAALSEQYDRIIIDTPPVLSVADSLTLANQSDAVVLVVRSGISRRKAVLRVRDLLRRSNSNLVGVVFNCISLKLENYYYAQGSGYGKAMGAYYDSEEEA